MAVAEALSIPPSVVEDEDEELLERGMIALTARRAVNKWRKSGDAKVTMDEAESAIFEQMMNELDALDEARGIPEEQ